MVDVSFMGQMRVSRGSFLFGLVLSLGFASLVWAGESLTLRANYSGVSGAFTPLWIAQDKGLFLKYGLSVDLKFIQPGTATQALLGKSLDITNPGGELIEAGLSGEKVVFFAGILNRVVFSMYSKPEIRAVADLRGKVLGMTQIVAAMVKGSIDAGIISAPTTLNARQEGFKELVNITERNIPMIHAAFASTRDFLKDHPERARPFLQGYLEGIKVARADADLSKQIIGKYTKTSNAEDLEETYRTFVVAWEKVPYVSAAAVQTLLNFAVHPAARSAKPEQFIDNSLLKELERSGFIDKLYQP